MCLYIHSKHPRNGATRTSFVTKVPLLVFKALSTYTYFSSNNGKEYAHSPYQMSPWHFGQKRTARMSRGSTGVIHRGLHAYATRDRAINVWCSTVYPAIIPPGTRVYFGMNGDIACEALTVYKNMADVLKVHGRITGKKAHKHILELDNVK